MEGLKMQYEMNVLNQEELLKEIGLRKKPISKISVSLDTTEKYEHILIYYQSTNGTVYKTYSKKINDKNRKIYNLITNKYFGVKNEK